MVYGLQLFWSVKVDTIVFNFGRVTFNNIWRMGMRGDADGDGIVEQDAAISGIGYGGYARKVMGM